MVARIIAARRSAVVPRGGAFAGLRIEDLATPVVTALLADAASVCGIGSADVDELIVAEAVGLGGNPARRIALAAGLPGHVAGLSIDRQCAGGLDAIALGAALIAAGRARVVIAGGVESASRRPQRAAPDGAGGFRPYDQAPFTPWPGRDPGMTEAAAALAEAHAVSRDAQDAWAVESHARARAVPGGLRSGGPNPRESDPREPDPDWPEIVVIAGQSRDPFTRRLTPAIAARAPLLRGSVSAANAAVAADGAAFVLLVARDLLPRGRGARALRVAGAATRGAADPKWPGLAAIPAMRAAMAEAGIAARDLAQAEIMEAYAVQAILTARALLEGEAMPSVQSGSLAEQARTVLASAPPVPIEGPLAARALPEGEGPIPDFVNPRGGGLARGHPIGASGAVLAVRLFHDLRPGGGPGLAAIAAAGGIGSALVLAPA
ncbi:thiolase family protein [Pseudogemmobacter sonorensis]|uniref:thiolase family protein n=1 Tax=Pseudogemmobacter sonorensis TaxID=2989681 RepID=UPI0036C99AB8